MNNSIWIKDVVFPSFPKLETDLKTDILIIGGGLAGILCAWKLHQAGIDYALVEANTLMSGVSQNTTAKLTSQHGFLYHKLLGRFGSELSLKYYLANENAIKQYRETAKAINCNFEIQDNFIYTLQNLKKLDKEWHALQQLGIPCARYDQLELPFPVAGAICFSRQAQFHPLKYVATLAEDLHIYEHTTVNSVERNTAVTDFGKIRAEKIIIATHFPIINKYGMYFLKMYQQRSYVLALEGGPKLDGMYLNDDEEGLSFRNYGDLLLLGGGSHRTGKQGGSWADLKAFAAVHYPDTTEVCRWATQDCMTLDDMPYIGQYSKSTPDLYVVTGFNKWGMTSSMVAASVISDLVQEKDNPYADLFDPSRNILRPQLAANVLESTMNLLTLTKPRCPHLGCALKWNSAEHSWDCPCHGSRFTKDGQLLNNPATDDLK